MAKSLWDQTIEARLKREQETGALRARREVVLRMKGKLPTDDIVAYTGMPLEEVERILKEQ